MSEYQGVVEAVARELFDIWKEAKSTCEDNWDDATWDGLPERHKHEYYLTAKRILSLQVGNLGIAVIEKESKPPQVWIDVHIWRDYSPDMAYEKCLQDILKAGWRKVVLPEE